MSSAKPICSQVDRVFIQKSFYTKLFFLGKCNCKGPGMSKTRVLFLGPKVFWACGRQVSSNDFAATLAFSYFSPLVKQGSNEAT